MYATQTDPSYGQGTYSVPGSQAPINAPQTQSSVAQGAYAPVQIGQAQAAPVAQVQAPNDPQAYFDAVRKSFQPQFDAAQHQQNAEQVAMGTLGSGAGNYQNQELTARNNATLAGAEAPLIQQGFGQEFAARQGNAQAQNTENLATQGINAGNATTNAGATNDYFKNLQDQYYNAGQNQLTRNLTGQEFNSNLLAGIYKDNTTAQNALQLARLGYGNSNYQQQVGIDAGLVNGGANAQYGTTANGQKAQSAAYLDTQTANNPYLAQIGSASQIPTSPFSSPSPFGGGGFTTTGSGNSDIGTYDPNLGYTPGAYGRAGQ